jgi:hypothetical protein
MFLQLVERFTPWHLRILKAFQNPLEWARTHQVNYRPAMTSSLTAFLLAAFPELRDREPFYQAVHGELGSAGLLSGGLSGMMTETGWQAPRTTVRGNAFLRFIEEPPVKAES